MPKVVFINKSTGTGGAALAALRLFRAHRLYLNNWELEFLAQEGSQKENGVHILTRGRFSKYGNITRLAIEKLFFLFYEKSKDVRFQFSIANTGRDISKNLVLENTDIIHLHWLYQGFLSLTGMNRLFSKGIPVVWTLHDMWPFTGGCHYPGNCTNYKDACGNCPFLKQPAASDLSNRIHLKKQELFNKYPGIVFVSCSEWLARIARTSSVLRNHRIEVIPNTLDINTFSPGDKQIAREKLHIDKNKFIILFGAANVTDKRKGFNFLLEALDKLKSEFPVQSANIELMVFGKAGDILPNGYKVHNQNLVGNENMLPDIYRAADVFVLPSLEDNLPNTIMESLACGTPVVAFNSGGIPEMIDHMHDGYLASNGDTDELTKGILWIKGQAAEGLAISCRNKVLDKFHPEKVSFAYKNLYQSLIK
jgi:glycosyltransferase involved in cell wall biosynthesis